MSQSFAEITNELVFVTGGRSTQLPTVAGQQAAENLQGCLQWARGSKEGREQKIGLCNQEYVRRNWDNFGANQPQPY